MDRSLTGSECEGYAGGRRKGGGWDVRGSESDIDGCRERARWEERVGQVGGESRIGGRREWDRCEVGQAAPRTE